MSVSLRHCEWHRWNLSVRIEEHFAELAGEASQPGRRMAHAVLRETVATRDVDADASDEEPFMLLTTAWTVKLYCYKSEDR